MMETQEKVNSFILYTEQWPAISLLNDVQRFNPHASDLRTAWCMYDA